MLPVVQEEAGKRHEPGCAAKYYSVKDDGRFSAEERCQPWLGLILGKWTCATDGDQVWGRRSKQNRMEETHLGKKIAVVLGEDHGR